MPLRNRVTPLGELVADPARGLVYGNRGCLHDEHGTIRRRYAGKRWIACRLEFRGWKRTRLLQPGRFTELFFLDEGTAFAAGHRPCALCRYEDYRNFVTLWHELHPGDDVGVDAIDARLHAERVEPGSRGQRRHEAGFETLPDGAFVLHDDAPWLVTGDRLLRWTPAGYTTPTARPRGRATVLTPPRSCPCWTPTGGESCPCCIRRRRPRVDAGRARSQPGRGADRVGWRDGLSRHPSRRPPLDHTPARARRAAPPRRRVERAAGFVHTRANVWRYEPGAVGRRHRHTFQEETFVVLAGTLSMYLGEPPERQDVPTGGVIHVEPGTPLQTANHGKAISSFTPTAPRQRTSTPRSSAPPCSRETPRRTDHPPDASRVSGGPGHC